MDTWDPLDEYYVQRVQIRQRKDREREMRAALQREYALWAGAATESVLLSLALAVGQRLSAFQARTGAPCTVSDAGRIPLGAAVVSAFSVGLWECSVHVYVQHPENAPPAVHLLRQWGGYRSPKMACLPGAWLKRGENGAMALLRFDDAGTETSLDELGAQVVSLLLEGATRG